MITLMAITFGINFHYGFGPVGAASDPVSWGDTIYVKPWS